MLDDRTELHGNARFLDALLDVGVIGEWSFDYRTKICRSSARIAFVFGVDAERGKVGEPVEIYERAIHPNDVAWLRGMRASAPGASGLRVTELRVTGADGMERWISVRGRYIVDADEKPVFGYGIMLDMTAYHESGDEPMVTPAAPFGDPLIVLANSLSTSYRAARQLSHDAIEAATRTLMIMTARMLSRQIQSPVIAARKSADRDRAARGKFLQ